MLPEPLIPMQTLQQLRAGELAGARQLKLQENLDEFPAEIFSLAESLEVLDLSGNQLNHLPQDFARLHKLRVLFCSGNPFRELPAVLGQCPQLEMIGFKSCQIELVPSPALPAGLRWLILTDNRITALPEQIGHCARLQKLMLAGNRLTGLPDALANCRQLELLRLSANQLPGLPRWLFDLPRLAWLALSGNPMTLRLERRVAARHPLPVIDWSQIKLDQRLGEGASGVIYRALWHASDQNVPVAVKLFKGAVTSDGLPQSELAACLAAGRHHGLIPLLGEISGHPQQQGVVMALIDPSFRVLAGPPSLASCTRDVYPADTCLDVAQIVRIATDIADATLHLHQRGMIHGDLYAHNILHHPGEGALLGDFGAASILPQDVPLAAASAIEMRAFGCLLQELGQYCDWADEAHQQRWLQLAALCLAPDPAARPDFALVLRQLRGWQAARPIVQHRFSHSRP